MKVKIFAVVTLGITLSAVVINTIILRKQVNIVYYRIKELDLTESSNAALSISRDIYDDFKQKEKYISLTVNHNDLTNIENCFAELIGYLSVDDLEGAEVTKNRLLDSLCHLGRLSSFNLDSII